MSTNTTHANRWDVIAKALKKSPELPRGTPLDINITALTDKDISRLKTQLSKGAVIEALELNDCEHGTVSTKSLLDLLSLFFEDKIDEIITTDDSKWLGTNINFTRGNDKSVAINTLLENAADLKVKLAAMDNPAETGIYKFKATAVNAAKAILLEEFLRDQGDALFYLGNNDGVPIEYVRDKKAFRIAVNDDYSRNELSKKGFTRKLLKREQDNHGRHYIVIPESEVDRVLQIGKAQVVNGAAR